MDSGFDDIRVVNVPTISDYGKDSSDAFAIAKCSACPSSQMAVVAHSYQNSGRYWLSCVECGTPHVRVGSLVWPSSPPLSTPEGLAPTELAVWREIRGCLGIGAYTSAVMMCRKMLFHLAVSNGLAAKDDKGRAPNFAEATKHLEAEGIITSRMRPWVDRIKDIGNEANHELEAISEKDALDVARFTEQLLRLSFEMDSLVAAATKADAKEQAVTE